MTGGKSTARGVWFAAGDRPWFRFAATGAATSLSLGWAASRHAAEWRAFFRVEPAS